MGKSPASKHVFSRGVKAFGAFWGSHPQAQEQSNVSVASAVRNERQALALSRASVSSATEPRNDCLEQEVGNGS
jgi:hypothetical protein